MLHDRIYGRGANSSDCCTLLFSNVNNHFIIGNSSFGFDRLFGVLGVKVKVFAGFVSQNL